MVLIELPTVEEIRFYAKSGMTLNEIVHYLRLPNAKPLMKIIKQDDELRKMLLKKEKPTG